MSKQRIRQLIESRTSQDGLTESGIKGVRMFRATQAIPCVPAVYEPSIVAIVSGSKEAVLDGHRYVYDDNRYLCCPMSMPVKAGTPKASTDNPLYGVFISLNQRVMAELVLEMENVGGALPVIKGDLRVQGIRLAEWDESFTDALLRLLQLGANPTDAAVLGDARLRELYYAVLQGEAGAFARQAFGAGNAIARSISHVSSHLDQPISIDDMATRAGMSRAVFHRKFKQVTTMAPIQFVKSMRLNNAAMKIAGGMTVNEAAIGVGYVSPSQFSREFKRMYGQSPRQWGEAQQVPMGVT
ncbi:AraC family transcriptional regulator [Sulfitobacter donghicola]|uniref:AraC family transcriptional regulator n=1 Tax=Sulfitobacter donghicola DSW-25 = KCTC 12864 = JCM 14565 TaxID=1300350 RepID=A0A073IHU5_9RHOB|nr:AraC family transcriptional regulator [Sulfitobacter donghicola]KEJ89051.1 AraC family transcriptional regulator [Sulfitobacter donghicola DSW-25 = KCTC 12864 = JCM 14565]KIN67381.1 AraC family transcription regulatory protein [Sulfitobacter donghicola DSW-25 = KCTC 12864 = JCM 14565]